MSRQYDLSKPLSDEDIAELKKHMTLEQVDRMVAQAQGSDFEAKPRRSRGGKAKEETEEESTEAEAGAPAEED